MFYHLFLLPMKVKSIVNFLGLSNIFSAHFCQWILKFPPKISSNIFTLEKSYNTMYRVSFKEWTPLVLVLVTTILLWLLQLHLMSCLLWIYLSKEVQYIPLDPLELNLHIKMRFQSDHNFYVFEQNLKGWEFVCKVT